MRVFQIDGFPLEEFSYFCKDYNSKIVYSALSDPPFRYSVQLNKFRLNALSSYSTNSKKKIHRLIFRDDLFFSDGSKVFASHYSEAVRVALYEYGLPESKFSIETNEQTMVLTLDCAIDEIPAVLSQYTVTPICNKLFSGPYKFKNIGEIEQKNSIELERNVFFRLPLADPENGVLVFSIVEENKEDLRLFQDGKGDITSNTTFPLECINEDIGDYLHIYPSYIFMSINVLNPLYLTPYGKTIRKFVECAIDRVALTKLLYDFACVANDFLVLDYLSHEDMLYDPDKAQHLSDKVKKKCFSLSLAYDDYYPNKVIASAIKEQLGQYGVCVELIEDDYRNPHVKCDLKLILSHPDYYSNTSFYCSKYFRTVLSIAPVSCFFYRLFLKKMHANMSNKTNLHRLIQCFSTKSLKIPLLKMYSIYACNSSLSDFSFIEMNYDVL